MSRRSDILQSAAALIATSGLRTSLQEIADAAGILPGSLYHHFESKEAIFVELLRRYHDDLDQIARQAEQRLDDAGSTSAFDRLVDLGSVIAQCAVTHRAALQMTFYEFPSDDPDLTALARQRPSATLQATLQTLRAARWSGHIGSHVDIAILADRFVQTMLHVGLDVIRNDAGPDKVAALLCTIMLQGLATRAVSDAELDASAAFRAADEVVRSWQTADAPDDDAARVRAVARAEFGRKGYEFTSIRDIAAAAGMGTGTVYRLIGSKDQLLTDIMRAFGEKMEPGWTGVLSSDSSPLEKLDAVSWIHTNVLDRFGDEFRIQLAWMRQSPPDTRDPGWLFSTRVGQMETLLAEGINSGELTIDGPSTEMLARAVIGLGWIPENILRDIGTRAALIHIRDTSLRGVATRSD
ncbi:TetR family transcriptional regulator [Mycobacterium sp. ENV421]|uniref:TetR/AcrR family transcriptional regulator n=1 Tax=Mycobacterium sp. ENV421 TaxID=1213407 RepID=UPI000C9BD495|nr:TetR/AcrR family transcriptional regulator [Mycobacterium sp. ENV421]PND59129.1 TetR family transcriptional regulator [Mycobacterium sp. ENV421]